MIDDTGAFVDVTRPYKTPVVRPASGDAALIDPRRENPLDFLMLDLRDTFEFTPIADAGTQDYERATYTIEVQGLNDRDYLVIKRERPRSGTIVRCCPHTGENVTPNAAVSECALSGTTTTPPSGGR